MPSFSRLMPLAITLALLGGVLAVASKNMIVDLDLFHEMALYRQMESEGSMPTTDAFAYTPTNETVVHHEWGTGAVIYLATVSTGWGASALVALKYFLTFAVCFGCFFYAKKQGAGLAVFSILAPFALNLGGWMAFNNIRAQLFTLLFLVILLFLLDLDRRGKRWWVLIWFPLFIIWSNMHGGVVSGMGILGVYCFARLVDAGLETRSPLKTLHRVWHLVITGLVTLILLIVNPYGWEYIPYLYRAVSMDRPLILEWRPIWEIRLPLIYGISVLIAAYAIWREGRTSIFESLALILTAYLAAKHYRHGSLYAVTWACMVPPMIQRSGLGQEIKNMFDNYRAQITVTAFSIALIAIGYSINVRFWELKIPNQISNTQKHEVIYPAGAADYLRSQSLESELNLFVPFAAGAFVQWKLHPQVKVSIDSRYEVAYPDAAIVENDDFYKARKGWQTTLQRYDTHAILVPVNSPLGELLAQDDSQMAKQIGWSWVYKDSGFAVYVPDDTLEKFTPIDRTGEPIQGVFP